MHRESLRRIIWAYAMDTYAPFHWDCKRCAEVYQYSSVRCLRLILFGADQASAIGNSSFSLFLFWLSNHSTFYIMSKLPPHRHAMIPAHLKLKTLIKYLNYNYDHTKKNYFAYHSQNTILILRKRENKIASILSLSKTSERGCWKRILLCEEKLLVNVITAHILLLK